MGLNLPKKRIMVAKAPFWKRALSFIIDILIIQFIIFMPYSGVIQGKLPVTDNFMQNYKYIEANSGVVEGLIPMFVVMFALVFVYFVIFEFKFGQTPGKMIMKLKLQLEKKEKMTVIKAVIRNMAAFPIFPFTLLWIIDPLYLLITGNRLSDNFSKTRMVEEITI
ncbi:MAG: RDD family protein [Nanoarchaeota archaeon]